MQNEQGKTTKLIVISILAIIYILLIFGVAAYFGMERAEGGKTPDISAQYKENQLDLISFTADSVELRHGKDVWLLQFLDRQMVRVHIKPNGQADADTPVLAQRTWPGTDDVKIRETERLVTMTNPLVRVEINKIAKTLRFNDSTGSRLIEMLAVDDFAYEAAFAHESGEQFYGMHGFSASENNTMKMVRDGTAVIEAGTQGNAGAPYIWSLQRYGLLFDTTTGSFTNFQGRLSLTNRSKKDLQYVFIAGQPLELQQALAELSGKPPMFPKWALGFNNSEWGLDENELLDHLRTYRAKQIPLDNFTLDFDWKDWGEDNYGESRWNSRKFPSGASGRLKQQTDALGVKLTGIMKPRIHVNTAQGRYATENGLWWPDLQPFDDYFSKQKVNVLNFALPKTRSWYFNDYVKQTIDTGIVGWWNDEADEMYDNLQFMNMQKTLYDGQRSYNNERVWSINRNYFLGSQRYAYGMWSGDIGTGFYSMARQRERMLAAVNIGQAKWGMDTGGFHGTPNSENYARWVQFSAFTPMFRVHGTLNEQRQPWLFGAQAERVAKQAIELRYRLIPYMYAYERQAYETGIGLIKPLVYDYPNDTNVVDLVDSWMFGDHLLVSPVVEEGQTQKSIYLPAGQWTDYFTGKVYRGGQTIQYPVNAKTWEDIPLFVKQGAIIPTWPVMNYIGERVVTDLAIDLWPAEARSAFTIYDDDGQTYDYEKGVYFRQPLALSSDNRRVTIELGTVTGSYLPPTMTYTLNVQGVEAQAVAQADGEPVPFEVQSSRFGPVTVIQVPAGKSLTITLDKK